MAAGDVDLEYEMVGGSVKRLLKLHDVVQQLESSVGQLRERQTTAVWTDVDALSMFARKYRSAIGVTEADLQQLREELGQASRALAASLRSHELRDAEEQERMRALLARLDAASVAAARPAAAPAPSATTAGGARRSVG